MFPLACVRPQPSRVHRGPRRLRFRGVDLWSVSIGSPRWCGVSTRNEQLPALVSTLNRADDCNDCDGQGLTAKFANAVLAEP